MRAVGPPLVLAVVGLVALSIIAAVGALILVVALISALSGDDDGACALVLLWMGGMGVLLVAVVGAVAWGLVRMLRSGHVRGETNSPLSTPPTHRTATYPSSSWIARRSHGRP